MASTELSQATPKVQQPTTPQTLLDYTLRTAPMNVVKSTAAFTTLGALTGSGLGIVKNLPAMPAAFNTGLNTGMFAFTFFSIREYAIHPLLTTLELRPSPFNSHELASSSPHTQNLLSTAIAGFSAGGLFSYFMRGNKISGLGRQAVTLSAGCCVVQVIVNEADIIRIKSLAWGEERQTNLRLLDQEKAGAGAADSSAPPPTYTRDISHATPSVPSRETFSERSDRLIGSGWNWTKEKISRLSPVKKLEQTEYENRLTSRLNELNRDRKQVEIELNELEARLKK